MNCQDKISCDQILRFAPSPTGEPHIGNIRTALINYILKKSTNSKMKLRIEDTDKERSKNEYVQFMLDGLKWLDIHYDDEPIIQSEKINRHIELANQLLHNGSAYKCFCNIEIDEMCNCKNNQNQNIKEFAIKLYIEKDGFLTINDKIKGLVTQKNENLQDIVLVRKDGFPTYMFCVVVDDHDMNITLVVRGDDHLTNTFKQIHIYNAFHWLIPDFAHLPMLLAPDGTKLSKRNSVTNLQHYINEGILPEALKNYLLLLSWRYEKVQKANNLEISEIFDMNMVEKFFLIEDVRKSPSKFDFQKLLSVNGEYINKMDTHELMRKIEKFKGVDIKNQNVILSLMPELKKRSKTLKDLSLMIEPYIHSIFDNIENFLQLNDECASIINNSLILLKEYIQYLVNIENWNASKIEQTTKLFVEKFNIKLVDIAQPVRICIIGSKISPGIFEIMELLKKEEVIKRIERFLD